MIAVSKTVMSTVIIVPVKAGCMTCSCKIVSKVLSRIHIIGCLRSCLCGCSCRCSCCSCCSCCGCGCCGCCGCCCLRCRLCRRCCCLTTVVMRIVRIVPTVVVAVVVTCFLSCFCRRCCIFGRSDKLNRIRYCAVNYFPCLGFELAAVRNHAFLKSRVISRNT